MCICGMFEMKNNILYVKPLKSCDIGIHLPVGNDFLELPDTGKLEPELFPVSIDELYEAIERYVSDDFFINECDCHFNEEMCHESESNDLIYAGYVDCMDEAIRFLIEEENISPEHPIVQNMRGYLEKSKERIFGNFCETNLSWTATISTAARKDWKSKSLSDRDSNHIRNCRDFG